MRPLSLSRLYYLCDPAVPVVGGPLMRGYETMLAGSVHRGKHIIAEYLASQYKIRHEERCTADFVPAACRRLNVPLPASREETPDDVIYEAAAIRTEKLHIPLFRSIQDKGYIPEMGPNMLICRDGQLLIGDGKNRASILAALGVQEVTNWEWLRYLTFQEYEKNAANDPQWKSYRERWTYHSEAIEEIRKLNPESVLEIGSFGCPLVRGSDTLDMPNGSWPTPWFEPTYRHDIRQFPWPVEDKRYDLLVALRVWHHLGPIQRECFEQARKIAKHLLIVCPEREIVGRGITRSEWDQWYGGKPEITTDLGDWGMLYVFRGI